MVIYQKLLPRTKKRGVFYLSLKISLLNRLASYDEYPPDLYRYFKTLPDWIRVILLPADWDVQIPPASWITDRKQEMERTFYRKKEKLAQLLSLNVSIILVSVDVSQD